MKISGYGEFQQMRKLAQKDDALLKENAERAAEAADENSDSVFITPAAQRKAKLRLAPDFRQTKVADVKARLEAGTLVTSESLKNGARKMLDNLLSGEL